jgi:hypothetical protein
MLMNHEIELYIHTADHCEPKLIKIDDHATVEEVLKQIAPQAHGEMHLSLEGADDSHDRNRKLHECGIKHRHHVHCHRCKKVTVTVFYNGEKSHAFPPSATIEKVLHWALHAFGLKGADALDKVLRRPEAPNEVLPETAHVGSYVKTPHCELRLNLTGKVEVNG